MNSVLHDAVEVLPIVDCLGSSEKYEVVTIKLLSIEHDIICLEVLRNEEN